ncbi:Elongator complex protein [Mortierella claussenii]|nr:Elongator complex protein [Mortierella claussenii]
MAPILEKILTGKESSPFILVKDTVEQSGQILGLELLNKTPTEYAARPDTAANDKDPKYNVSRSRVLSTRMLTYHIIPPCNVEQSNFTVYFDSLSQFLVASVPDTFNLIRSMIGLLTDTSRIIAVHHEDMPDGDSWSPDASKPLASHSLAHIATTLVTLKNSEAIRQDQEDLRRGVVAAKEFSYLTVHGNTWDSAVCEVEHKRKSGKVARETNAYHLGTPTGELVVVNVWDVVGDMPDIDKLNLEESQMVDPAANLSFNLNLTEEQRRAKNDTVLPYLKTQESTGAIYYEPDAADDFDDDDPDDDLTI